jgi:hypothetical protein
VRYYNERMMRQIFVIAVWLIDVDFEKKKHVKRIEGFDLFLIETYGSHAQAAVFRCNFGLISLSKDYNERTSLT